MYMKMPRSAFFILLVMIMYYSIGSAEVDDTVHIMWNVVSITAARFDVFVYIKNNQLYRSIYDGWQLRWTWSADQVIWSAFGATAKNTGTCRGFIVPGTNGYPLSCQKSPTMVDLPPFAPRNLRMRNCCRGGYLSSPFVDPTNNTAAFRLMLGNQKHQVDLSDVTTPPTNFSLAPDYHCYSPVRVNPEDAGPGPFGVLLSWLVKCRYSQPTPPRCCVSLSGFYNSRPFSVECPDNTCGFSDHLFHGDDDDDEEEKSLSSLVKPRPDMCPVGVQWHVINVQEDTWWVRISVKNYNAKSNYANWIVAIQHPSLEDVIRIDLFNYTSTVSSQNVTMGIFWGTGGYNIITPKREKFALLKLKKHELVKRGSNLRGRGWTLPSEVYFNGFQCTIPNHTLFMSDDRRLPNTLFPNELNQWHYVVALALIITLSVAYLHIMHYRNFVRQVQPFN